jgi:integrase
MAMAALDGQKADGATIFGGLTYSQLDHAFRRIRKSAELKDVRLHDLRHTAGTYAGAAGLNAFVVRDLLGHKTLQMTNRYVERFADPLRQASNLVADRIAAAMASGKGDGPATEIISIGGRPRR